MMRGLVLAGGKSRRFGSDKALAVYQGESFLSRATLILRSIELCPVIVTSERAFYPIPEKDILLRDRLPEKGPLGGIYTAMKEFPGDDFLVLTCDMPALDTTALSGLLEAYKKKPLATFYEPDAGQIEPFPGIYPSSLFQNVVKNILMEKLAIHQLIRPLSEKNIIAFSGPSQVLMNVNHPYDFDELSR